MKRSSAISLILLGVASSSLVSCVPLVAGGAFMYAAGSDRYSEPQLEPSEKIDFGTDGGWGQFEDARPQP